MNDKEWLDRVSYGYKIYCENNPDNNIKEFIIWLYKQYGIIVPNTLKD